jgi:hypothetical protein
MSRRTASWQTSYRARENHDLIAARACGIRVRGPRSAPTRPGRTARPATRTTASRRTNASRGDPDDEPGEPLAGRFDLSAEVVMFP